jgi:hypothetical protein
MTADALVHSKWKTSECMIPASGHWFSEKIMLRRGAYFTRR